MNGNGNMDTSRSPLGATLGLAAQPEAGVNPELVAVVAAALTLARRLGQTRGGLGGALQSGPSAWWAVGHVVQQGTTWWRMPMPEQTVSPSLQLRLRAVVDGHAVLVEIGDARVSPISVRVDGQLFQVKLEFDTPATDFEPGARRPARAPLLTTPAAGHPPNHVLGQRDVKAPMPGTILEVVVRPGDQVVARQTLCWLEAMKMRNAIRAPRSGVIASVDIRDGQVVAKGDLLFTFA